ncbi:MAG TPA: HEAT repeat domain-containing protein, partial [Planctomycetota bacterium]
LSETQENVTLLAVGRLERNTVLHHVSARMALGVEPAGRLAAVAFTGAVGRANDLLELCELALPPEQHELSRHSQKALRRAVTTILGRDPKAFEQLVSLRRLLRPALLPTVVAAVGDARDGAGLAFLAEVAYWAPKLIDDVISQVRLVGLSSVESVNDTMRVRLRPYLDEERPGTCRAAILALVALEDDDSIGPIIALLASEDAGLRENAHWALCKLTGLTLAPTKETWARWHQAELAWLLRSRAREFQRLRSTDPAEVAAALRSILTHPLALDELRRSLPEVLRHHSPAARVLACGTLGELRASEAVEGLVWALEDPDRNVVVAAHSALTKITGLSLPCDPSAWQGAIGALPAEASL